MTTQFFKILERMMLKKNILILVSLMSIIPLMAGKGHRDKQCTKYVKGGACEGTGSKECPYNSLAAAEADTSWTTLIVLPSPVVLDGGIELRPGTTLKGRRNPTCGSLSFDQPTITNSSGEFHGGNGVVITEDATVECLHIKDTYAAGINYTGATDVVVNKVLITGHNQGNVTEVTPYGEVPVGGIFGQIAQSGATCCTSPDRCETKFVVK